MFGIDKFVIMYGTFEDGADPKKVKTFLKWNDMFFYKHVETFLQKPKHSVEYIPLRDYYHRHNRGIFWMVEIIMPYVNHAWFRNVFGWIFPFNAQLMKLIRPDSGILVDLMKTKFVLQDFAVPVSKFEEVIELSHREVEVSFPISKSKL